MPEPISMNDIYSAFGIPDPNAKPPEPPKGSEGDPPPQDPPQDPPKDPPAGDPPKDPPQDPPKDPPQDPPKDPPPDKAAQEFARMRVENKRVTTMLGDIAKILGVQDTSNTDTVMTALQQMVLKAQAKASGIPEEVLKEHQEMKNKLVEREQQDLRTQAFLGFQKVKDTYKLTDAELGQFADKLVAEGRNPFTTPMDMVKEYKVLYFEQIVEKEREKARQEEAARAAHAAAHSTQPAQKDGKSSGDPAKINTVKDLDKWFSEQK